MFLLVNNYEISIILYKYLHYWNKHQEAPYITVDYFFQILRMQNKGVFQLILDNKINYNIFFNFFCIMSFSQIDRIIKLVLSACGIHSNYGIGKEMAQSFFTKISESAMQNQQIMNFINNNDELITIKDLVSFIESNEELYNPFWQMRLSLVKYFFSERYFIKVIKRIMIYDSAFSRHSLLPKESCLSALYRILFLKEPPPYYTEYRDFDTNPRECDELFNYYIYNTRKKYGYSKRIGRSPAHSYASDTFNSSRSSFHSNIKLSQKNNALMSKKSVFSINQTQNQTHSPTSNT